MDAFWCITLGLWVLRLWWKHQRHEVKSAPPIPFKINTTTKTEAEKQRDRDIEELKRQGYTDEVIAVILPVINNGG